MAYHFHLLIYKRIGVYADDVCSDDVCSHAAYSHAAYSHAVYSYAAYSYAEYSYGADASLYGAGTILIFFL
jgi:hypothetical protein